MRYRACQSCVKSIPVVNIGGNLALASVKGFLGVVGGSQALVADAIHSLADLISSCLLLVGLEIARRPANERHPYGYGNVEFLVAVGIYLLLIGAGGFILFDSIHMIVDKEDVNPAVLTMFAAALSAVLNEIMYRQSVCAGEQLQSPSISANAAEKRADVYSSLAVLTGIIGAKLGMHLLDPIAAILVACLILHSSIKGLNDAFVGLLDRSLEPELLADIERAALAVPGVAALEAIRSRSIGRRVWVELDVATDGRQTIQQGEKVRRELIQAVAAVCAVCVDRPGDILVRLVPMGDEATGENRLAEQTK